MLFYWVDGSFEVVINVIKLIVDTIPDEDTALKTGGPAWPGQRQLPPNVVNQVKDLGDGQQMVILFLVISLQILNPFV